MSWLCRRGGGRDGERILWRIGRRSLGLMKMGLSVGLLLLLGQLEVPVLSNNKKFSVFIFYIYS